MKVLALCGSPRKGNTYTALANLNALYEDVDVEILMLKDMDLKLCKGCYACVQYGEDKCPLSDDRDMVLEKMRSADGVILASPVYSHMISALMKNLFDRLGYMAHRPEFFGKYALSLVTCSGYGADHAAAYLDKMAKVFGYAVAPPLQIKVRPSARKGSASTEPTPQAIASFDVFVDMLRTGEMEKPTLGMLVPFGIFKGIAHAARESMPADYEYYSDKTDFYYDVKLPAATKWIADRVVKKELARILE